MSSSAPDPAVTRRRLPPADRRRLILDAAAAVFAEQGYDAGSIDAIGARIGISGPAIYRHFARKQDMLVELLQRAVTAALAAFDEVAAQHDDPGPRMIALVDQLARMAIAEQTILRLLHTEVADLDPGSRERIARIRDALLARWVGELRRFRPALSDATARFHIQACFAVMGSMAAGVSVAEPDRVMLKRFIMALLRA